MYIRLSRWPGRPPAHPPDLSLAFRVTCDNTEWERITSAMTLLKRPWGPTMHANVLSALTCYPP